MMKSAFLNPWIACGLVGAVCLGGGRLAAAPAATPASAAPAAPAPAAPAGSELRPVTRVVGEAADHIVTSREVRMNRALESIMQSLGDASEDSVGEGTAAVRSTQAPASASTSTPAPQLAILTGGEPSFPAEVSRVLDEWAIFLEAKSLSSTMAPKGEVARVLKEANERLGAKEAWRSIEPSAEELRAIAERKIIARDFQRLKGSSSLVPVTETEALQYFRRNRLRFGTVPFAAVRENIKTFLTKQQTERRLEEWREVLRRKYKVRNFIAG